MTEAFSDPDLAEQPYRLLILKKDEHFPGTHSPAALSLSTKVENSEGLIGSKKSA